MYANELWHNKDTFSHTMAFTHEPNTHIYKDEITSLKYINKGVYNEMFDKITSNIPKKK